MIAACNPLPHHQQIHRLLADHDRAAAAALMHEAVALVEDDRRPVGREHLELEPPIAVLLAKA